jgi:hypothetical protein
LGEEPPSSFFSLTWDGRSQVFAPSPSRR